MLTRKDAECGFGPPNAKFLASILDKARPAVERSELPKTSAHEIGWFTKTYRPNLSTCPEPKSPTCIEKPTVEKKFSYKGITTFGLNPRVNHPKHYTEISRYMDTYWSYYPPPKAKFHPKAL